MIAASATAPTNADQAVKIPLRNGGFVIVDPEDAPRVRQYEWHTHTDGRAARWETPGAKWADRGRLIQLHRELMDPAPGLKVVALNHDPLDCRRANLLVCDQATVTQRSPTWKKRVRQRPHGSQFRGVERRDRSTSGWRAYIVVGGKRIRSKWFRVEVEAAHAYDALASQHYGTAAHLNFPDAALTNTTEGATAAAPPRLSDLNSPLALSGSSRNQPRNQTHEQ